MAFQPSSIQNYPVAGNINADDILTSINELKQDINRIEEDLVAHIRGFYPAGDVDSHQARSVINEPEGNITSTTVQGALNEIQAEVDGFAAGAGEANTASNQGTGVGVFIKKSGVDLQFKNIAAASTLVSVADNTAAGDIDIDFNTSALDHQNLLNKGTNTHTQIDDHISNSAIHVQVSNISHLSITDIGNNTHTQIDNHISDSSIHFPMSSITVTVSDNFHSQLQNVGTNSHTQIDDHISDTSIHFLVSNISHLSITDIGTNTHTQIDDHIGNTSIHTEISNAQHSQLLGVGTNNHTQIDDHIGNTAIHFVVSSISHKSIIDIGTNTHTQIDDHISNTSIHFLASNVTVDQSNIQHSNINGVGFYTHSQVDAHISSVSNPHTVTIQQVHNLTARGDVFVYDGTTIQPFPRGSDGQFLRSYTSATWGIQWDNLNFASSTAEVGNFTVNGTLTVSGSAQFQSSAEINGNLDMKGNDIQDIGNIDFQTGAVGGTIRTGTSNADKWVLQAYDVDGGVFTTVAQADAGNSPTFTLNSTLRIDHLTTSRLVATDANKGLASADLNSWVAGTTNQVNVADDGDGSVTLSLPQSIATTSTVQFGKQFINNAPLVGGPVLGVKSGGTGAFARFLNSVSGGAIIDFDEDASGNARILMRTEAGATPIQLNTAGDTLFQGGNVGIGTGSPGTLLDVQGTATISGIVNATSDLSIFQSSGGTNNSNMQFSYSDSFAGLKSRRGTTDHWILRGNEANADILLDWLTTGGSMRIRDSGLSNTWFQLAESSGDLTLRGSLVDITAGDLHVANDLEVEEEAYFRNFNVNKGMFIYEDWLTNDVEGNNNWTLLQRRSAGIAQMNNTVADGNNHGVVDLRTGGSTDEHMMLVLGHTDVVGTPIIRLGGGAMKFEWMVYLPKLSTASEEFQVLAGLGDPDGSTFGFADFSNGIYFKYIRTANVNWIIASSSGGTITQTATSTAVSTGYTKLTAILNAAGTSIEYFIDGTSVGTITTNIPTSNNVCPVMSILKKAGTTSRLLLADYFSMGINFNTAR